jgi:hypothetical protein
MPGASETRQAAPQGQTRAPEQTNIGGQSRSSQQAPGPPPPILALQIPAVAPGLKHFRPTQLPLAPQSPGLVQHPEGGVVEQRSALPPPPARPPLPPLVPPAAPPELRPPVGAAPPDAPSPPDAWAPVPPVLPTRPPPAVSIPASGIPPSTPPEPRPPVAVPTSVAASPVREEAAPPHPAAVDATATAARRITNQPGAAQFISK